jgi:hypothetical protein
VIWRKNFDSRKWHKNLLAPFIFRRNWNALIMDCLNKKSNRNALFVALGIGILLTVILVPLTFSYVEYYEYGLVQRKTTGKVDVDTVYTRGRYNIGPDYTFIKYQADAHFANLEELSVFSSGDSNSSIGLAFLVDIDFTYLLKEDKIGQVHSESASSYRGVIESRTIEAIRNEAISVSFQQYFRNRKEVEALFKAAVQRRWDTNPPVHAVLDQFHLGRIQIPDSVAEQQLESRVQNERNGMEAFLQQAQVERDQTGVEVNKINLETSRVLQTARAEASLLMARATATALKTTTNALNNGTKMLFDAVGIVGQEQRIAFSYMRTLLDRQDLDLGVSYLSDENLIKTIPAS